MSLLFDSIRFPQDSTRAVGHVSPDICPMSSPCHRHLPVFESDWRDSFFFSRDLARVLPVGFQMLVCLIFEFFHPEFLIPSFRVLRRTHPKVRRNPRRSQSLCKFLLCTSTRVC